MARFVVSELDAETNSILESHILEIEDFSKFEDKLGIDPQECLTDNVVYDLTRKDMRWLTKHHGLKPVSGAHRGSFSAFMPYHDRPYKLHTNRELLMMLKGEKPMAFFTHEVGRISKKTLLSGQPFEKYVKAGRIIKRVDDRGRPHGVPIKVFYYALPGEEWRINAHMMLMDNMFFGRPWNETLERIEGQLLGYTDEQNDIHLAREYPKPIESSRSD